jgi:hypothetical protein
MQQLINESTKHLNTARDLFNQSESGSKESEAYLEVEIASVIATQALALAINRFANVVKEKIVR